MLKDIDELDAIERKVNGVYKETNQSYKYIKKIQDIEYGVSAPYMLFKMNSNKE